MNSDRKLVLANVFLTLVVLVFLLIGNITIGMGGSKDVYKSLQSKLSKHDELKEYGDFAPRITKLDKATIDSLIASGLTFYENAEDGDYLLEYVGMTAVYNPNKDKVVNSFEVERAPEDFDDKLFAHPEAASHVERVNEARLTRIDNQLLETAKENNATFFDNAKTGQYLLEWTDLVLVYDYENDEIVNFLTLNSLPTDFGPKLFAHSEVAAYTGTNPVITLLTEELLQSIAVNNPEFFQNARIGQYLLEWEDLVVIYDYNADAIVNILRPQQAPADLLVKLTAQEGLEDYATETPRVSIVTADVLPQLMEQFPEIYKDSKEGDYVVRYSNKLVIFDYAANNIVDSFDLVAQEQ